MNQTPLFDQAEPLTTDMHVLLQLFTNWRGIDVGQDWLDLLQVYHSVYEDPDKRPKTSWRPDRLRKALDKAEDLGLIADGRAEWGKDWMITAKGIQARQAAYLTQRTRKHGEQHQ